MKSLYILLSLTMALHSCRNGNDINYVTGIYGSPIPFWNQGLELKDLGVNAVFLHSTSITENIMKRAKREGVRVFAEFPILNGKDYVEQHPEAWARNERGRKVTSASWFMGVCPTDPGFRRHRMQQLRTLLQNYDVDGVWMKLASAITAWPRFRMLRRSGYLTEPRVRCRPGSLSIVTVNGAIGAAQLLPGGQRT